MLAFALQFQCVITKEMFREPVITSDGHTYERSAIKQWLESHDTSPRTGNVLPDRVLRPNHVLRSQIVEFRERHGLAALPVWEPDPQEVVTAPAAAAAQQLLATGQLHGPGGVGPPPMMLHPAQMVQILGQVIQDPGLAAQLAAMGVPGAASDPQTAINMICQNPQLMNHVMGFVAQSPEGQRILSSTLGPGMPGMPGMPVGAAAVAGGPAVPGDVGGAGGGMTEAPVFQAARQGEVAVVERLLGDLRGADFSAHLSPGGDSLLHVACWEGKTRLVRMLLARGHDVHALSRNKSTPLHYSSWNGHADTVKVLLEAGAETEVPAKQSPPQLDLQGCL